MGGWVLEHTRGRLVEEKDGGVGEKLSSHSHTLAFSSRDTTNERVRASNQSVSAALQADVQKNLLDSFLVFV